MKKKIPHPLHSNHPRVFMEPQDHRCTTGEASRGSRDHSTQGRSSRLQDVSSHAEETSKASTGRNHRLVGGTSEGRDRCGGNGCGLGDTGGDGDNWCRGTGGGGDWCNWGDGDDRGVAEDDRGRCNRGNGNHGEGDSARAVGDGQGGGLERDKVSSRFLSHMKWRSPVQSRENMVTRGMLRSTTPHSTSPRKTPGHSPRKSTTYRLDGVCDTVVGDGGRGRAVGGERSHDGGGVGGEGAVVASRHTSDGRGGDGDA